MTDAPYEQRVEARPPLLEVAGLKKEFPVETGLAGSGQVVHAVDGVSLRLEAGETLGVVGESGCGKSTLGRTVLRLIEPTAGKVVLDGRDITHLTRAQMRPYRRRMQIIFQDPYSSLNPRMTAGDIVGEPFTVHGLASGRDKEDRVAALFRRVGLRPEQMQSYPHEFSGGQRQRIGIARALSVGPGLIVADEPVSALDVSIQAQILNLLMDLQDELQVSYLLIAHDLSVVEHISRRVAVMYLGRIVELADRRDVFAAPLHPYAEALLSAAPRPEPRRRQTTRIKLAGELPSPVNPPSGCHFHTRCPYASTRCRSETPLLREVQPRHWVACHLR